MSRIGERPLVSIITCFLNQEKYLQEAIDSVRAQTYGDWELLLVDDGSTDDGTRIALEACRRDPGRVRYLEHPGHANRGLSPSRNLALRHARGEVIGFLDGDDLWLPGKLEQQVELLAAHPEAGALYGRSLFWFFDDDEEKPQDFVPDPGVEAGRLLRPPGLLTLILDDEDKHPPNCSMLVRRDLCVELGGWEERFRVMYEDTAFLAKLFLRAPVLVTGDCTSVYRRHAASACHRAWEEGLYDPGKPNVSRAAFLRWLQQFLKEAGTEDPGLSRVLRWELLPYDRPAFHALRTAARRARGWAARRVGRGGHGFGGSPGAEPGEVSGLLRELARLYRALGRDAEADRIDQRPLRTLGRRRSRVYTLLKGEVLAAGGGPGGAGVTLTFRPDDAAAVGRLPGRLPPRAGRGEIVVRLIGVDAPAEPQPGLPGGPGPFRGHLLTQGAGTDGRRVAFAFRGEAGGTDGGLVTLKGSTAGESLNAGLLREGAAYSAFDPSIPDGLRNVLAEATADARAAGRGVWGSGGDESWPKLRRRLDLFCSQDGSERYADGFAAWLRESGMDEPVVLAAGGSTRLSDLVEAGPGGVRLKVRPEEVVGLPPP